MITFFERSVRVAALVICFAPFLIGQDLPKEVGDKIDGAVADAYRTAAEAFPCKVKSRGSTKMLRWEDVDRCLNQAAARVDWDALAKKLQELRTSVYGISESSFAAALDTSLSAHALTFERVFTVKNEKSRLPLTNSLLKFLPADSLMDLPVFDKAGSQVGTFSGVYAYERAGGLSSANVYRLALFQYTDKNGNIQSAADKLLLDSFGVPWFQAKAQPGYRLTTDKLQAKR